MNLKELITAKGHKKAEAHGGEVEHPLGDDEADGEEQVGCRQEREEQEAEAEVQYEDINWVGKMAMDNYRKQHLGQKVKPKGYHRRLMLTTSRKGSVGKMA